MELMPVGRPLKSNEIKRFATIRPGVNEMEVRAFLSKVYDYKQPYNSNINTMSKYGMERGWSKATTDAVKRALKRAYGSGSKNKLAYERTMDNIVEQNKMDDRIVQIAQQIKNPSYGIRQSTLWREVRKEMGISITYYTFTKRLRRMNAEGKIILQKTSKNNVTIATKEVGL